MSDIDTAVVDGLKALDPKWPIREADICWQRNFCRNGPTTDKCTAAKLESLDHCVGAGDQRRR